MIYAKIIADSISPAGSRLTTIECQFHRFILPEVNTHRAFSRNSASSRAIPTRRLIEQVRADPAIPLEFGSNQPGMQAGPEVDNAEGARNRWKWAAEDAANHVELLAERGVHKQVVNRLLEPFMWHTAIITSTQAGWQNFFAQRCSPLAQPEINALAIAIRSAMDASDPEHLGRGYWHAPYLDHETVVDALERTDSYDAWSALCRRISAARCARVSYLTHDGRRDLAEDLALYHKLINAQPPHWSPLEHVATPDYQAPDGNLDGWSQLRHLPEFQ